MDKNTQKRINRNNRKRGGKFEKTVADFLGFGVVPYSGSNARYGFGDVRGDKWLIECKNITPDGDKITIQMKILHRLVSGTIYLYHLSLRYIIQRI